MHKYQFVQFGINSNKNLLQQKSRRNKEIIVMEEIVYSCCDIL